MAMPIPEPRWFSLGPHAYFDLVRLARRGRSTLVRILYILVLYGALAVVYREALGRTMVTNALPQSQARRINVNALIAERFCVAVLVTQNIAVLVLMPIYCAASVFEERDKRTLPILFTTHLTAREILLGKLISRIGHVGSVVLAGLPILAIAQLWGGIDMPMIAANFWNTGLWLVTAGALSLLVATQSRNLLIALVKTYLLLIGMSVISLCCCGCLQWPTGTQFLLQPSASSNVGYQGMWLLALGLTVAHGFLISALLRRARMSLDAQRGDDPLPPEPFDLDDELVQRYRVFPEVGDDPIAWKEQHVDATTWAHLVPLVILPYLAMVAVAFVILRIQDQMEIQREKDLMEARTMSATFMYFAAGIYLLLVAIRLTASIVRERERQTLDGLLVLPTTPGGILNAKVAGVALRYRLWLLPVVLAWVMIQTLGRVDWLAGFAVLLLLAVHFYFFAMLALFLSVICRSSVAAYVSLGIIVLTLFLGTVAFFEIARVGDDRLLATVNPAACWITTARLFWFQGTASEGYLPAIVVNAGSYLLAALALHFAAHRCFARTTQEGVAAR